MIVPSSKKYLNHVKNVFKFSLFGKKRVKHFKSISLEDVNRMESDCEFLLVNGKCRYSFRVNSLM